MVQVTLVLLPFSVSLPSGLCKRGQANLGKQGFRGISRQGSRPRASRDQIRGASIIPVSSDRCRVRRCQDCKQQESGEQVAHPRARQRSKTVSTVIHPPRPSRLETKFQNHEVNVLNGEIDSLLRQPWMLSKPNFGFVRSYVHMAMTKVRLPRMPSQAMIDKTEASRGHRPKEERTLCVVLQVGSGSTEHVSRRRRLSTPDVCRRSSRRYV